VSLVFLEMKHPMREKVEQYEFMRTIDPAHFSRRRHDAVAEFVPETGATWRSPGTAP
jgi:hypothetical protein